jgi:hypothetical protein
VGRGGEEEDGERGADHGGLHFRKGYRIDRVGETDGCVMWRRIAFLDRMTYLYCIFMLSMWKSHGPVYQKRRSRKHDPEPC